MGFELPDDIKKMANGLTKKQKDFADNYIETGNATKSAIDAGYSKKTANRIGPQNLSKLVIKKYIDARLAFIDSKKIGDSKEVLSFLTSVMRGELTEEVVDPEGGLLKRETSIRDRLKASELLGKRYRLFTDKIDANITGSVAIENIKNLSTDDLRKLANEKPQQKYDVNGDYDT